MQSSPAAPRSDAETRRRTDPGRLRPLVGGLLVAGLALAMRFLALPPLTRAGLWLSSMDDYGHLRRALRTVRDFPRVPSFDPFLNHPEGGLWIWPPLFELLIAAPARLAFGAAAGVGEVTFVAALVPPTLGLLTLPPLFFLVRRLFGSAEAWVATTAYALLPVAVRYSSFGHADQHVGEALFLVLVAAATVRLLATGSPVDTVLLALAVTGAHLMWQGAVFLTPLVAGSFWLAGLTRRQPAWRLRGAAALAVAGALLAIPALGRGLPTTYVSFGPFQPLFLLLFAGLLALAAIPRLGTALAALGGSVVAATWPPVRAGLANLGKVSEGVDTGMGYLAYPAEWLALIGEFRPLSADGVPAVLRENSLGLLLVPVAVGFWVLTAVRQRGRGSSQTESTAEEDDGTGLAFLAATTVVVFAMALFQKRYAYYLAVPVAVTWGSLTVRLWRRRRAGAILLVLAALAWSWPVWVRLTTARPAAGPDVFATLDWIGETGGGLADPFRLEGVAPGEVPGVLAPWSLGHLVTVRAGRPAGADNLGYGFHRQCEVYTAGPADDPSIARLLREGRFAFVVTAEMRPLLPAYAAAVGRTGVPLDDMLAARLHRSFERFPVPFLELVHVSATGLPGPDGLILPRLKVYRVLPDTETGQNL